MPDIRLNLILGPMFAGKSTYMIDTIERLIGTSECNLEDIVIINHSSDSRYDTGKICSHNGRKISSITTTNLSDIPKTVLENAKYIFIDEGQFFNDLYSVITDLIIPSRKNKEQPTKYIYISGLDGDFHQKPFTNSRLLELIPYACNITKLTAKCYKCDNIAPMTKRLINSNETILIGGADMYQPCCMIHLYD